MDTHFSFLQKEKLRHRLVQVTQKNQVSWLFTIPQPSPCSYNLQLPLQLGGQQGKQRESGWLRHPCPTQFQSTVPKPIHGRIILFKVPPLFFFLTSSVYFLWKFLVTFFWKKEKKERIRNTFRSFSLWGTELKFEIQPDWDSRANKFCYPSCNWLSHLFPITWQHGNSYLIQLNKHEMLSIF